MTANQVRQKFLDFFASKGHQIVPSAPIVVKNDPTLMFTNAGMNQFKDLFLGEAPIKYPRVADTQKCLRVSGKHNDLEEVGIDTYHHTMFEMLGNWSFGDYFKDDAIAWSWELLTEIYKLPKDRLYVTVFEGDEAEGLPPSSIALKAWKKLVPEDHIVFGNKKDNFWEMGDTGPCGPCSEIHYDSRSDQERAEIEGALLVNKDHPQVIEIWNNVFMQFNRQKDGSLKPLPAKHVDTGMGFERLVRVLQNKTSNYDTDVFQPLIQFIAQKSGKKYIADAQNGDTGWNDAVAMRVMADHIRAIAFAIADGQLPSNNKAGYVIRRILRRAVRYAYQYLGFKGPFLNELVPILASQFEHVFPELHSQQDFVQKVVKEEETSFLRTLETGIRIFNNIPEEVLIAIRLMKGWVNNLADSNYKGDKSIVQENLDHIRKHNPNIYQKVIIENKTEEEVLNTIRIRGAIAFELSDTYGFPIDLTQLMAREKGWMVDMEGYQKALEEQKNRSKAAIAVDIGEWINVFDSTHSTYYGYDALEIETLIQKYRKVVSKGRTQFQFVLQSTTFYAESGGQVGDSGIFEFPTGEDSIYIIDTIKENGLILHIANEISQELNLFRPVKAIVNKFKRGKISANHSATHLMHAALKQVLGAHVNQKGSLVNDEYLRFDFSHFAKLSDEELEKVEDIVNEKIRENIVLKEERDVPYQTALNSGVTALFGEKYGDYVRVITFDDGFSKELCGGTHVSATGKIGLFKIVSESAVAAGVRRIEAYTGKAAFNYLNNQLKTVKQLKDILKNPADVAKSVEEMQQTIQHLNKEIAGFVKDKASAIKNELAAAKLNINGINFIAAKVNLPNQDFVKNLAYELKDIVENLFLVLATVNDGKPSITVMIAENIVKSKNLNAGNIVKDLAKEINGGGGGQPFYATAGGKDATGIDRVFEKAKQIIS